MHINANFKCCITCLKLIFLVFGFQSQSSINICRVPWQRGLRTPDVILHISINISMESVRPLFHVSVSGSGSVSRRFSCGRPIPRFSIRQTHFDLTFNCAYLKLLLFTGKCNTFYLTCGKAPVTPNVDATAFVQRSKNMSARCEVAAKYA